MPKLLRYLVLFSVLFILFLPASTGLAQSDVPSVTAPTQSNAEVLGLIDDIFGFISNLFNSLTENKTDKDMDKFARSGLPRTEESFDTSADEGGQDAVKVVAKTASDYGDSEKQSNPGSKPVGAQSFWDKIASFFGIGDAMFGNKIINEGNQHAEDLLASELPREVAKESLARLGSQSRLAQNRSLAQSDFESGPQVLQAESQDGPSDSAMEYSLDVSRCADLPLALCPDGTFSGTEPEPEESPPPDEEPPPDLDPGEVPPECLSGSATCYDGNREDCYQDTSISDSCWIIEKGWCSEACLSAYFKGDADAAKKASMICWRESMGIAQIANKSCTYSTDGIDNDNKDNNEPARCIDLKDTVANGCNTPEYDRATVDYSIGLFQINLLAHCPAAQPSYTWDPPTCSFGNTKERDNCETNLKKGLKNIEFAIDLSNDGTYWHPWAASREKYCDIEKFDK